MQISDALDGWMAYRAQLAELGSIKPATVANQDKTAAIWKRELGHLALGYLRKSHIDLAVARLAKSRSPITLSVDVGIFAQFLNWCVDERYIAERPRLPTVSVAQQETELPPDAAFLWVLTNTPEHTAAGLEFMLLTGLAPHELERLRTGDYDEERHAIGVGQRADFQVKAAARKRWVPLNARALEIWRHAAHGRLKRYTPFSTVEAMEKAIQRARQKGRPRAPRGVEAITPKTMRKWFASKLAGDVAEHVLQTLLGHAPGSRITRRHYVRSSAADTERAVDALHIMELQ